MTYEIDGEQVVEAARQYAGTPLDKMRDAYGGAKNATLSPLAFGLVGAAIVGGSYEKSRAHWENELKGGVDRWVATIQGLNKVATNHHAAETASTINAGDSGGPAGGAPSGGSSADSRANSEAVVLGGLWMLAVENLAIATVLGVASVMAPVAIVACVGWAAFSPADDELNEASRLWSEVHRNLEAFPDSLGTGTRILDVAWPAGQPSRTAFDSYLFQYIQEVKDATHAAATNNSTLDSLNDKLSSIQNMFFIEAAGALAAMVAAQACTAIPVVGAAFEAMVQAIGGGLAAAATGTVAIVVNTLYACFQALENIAGAAHFATAAPASDDHPPHFTDVRIDWDGA